MMIFYALASILYALEHLSEYNKEYSRPFAGHLSCDPSPDYNDETVVHLNQR